MNEKLKDIINECIVHNSFFNKSDLINAIELSYNSGLNENQEKYDILKSAFEELLNHVQNSYNLDIEVFKKKAGI